MLGRIKQIIYSAGLFLGSKYSRDTNSKIIYYHDLHESDEFKLTEMSTPLDLFTSHLQILKSEGWEVVKTITKPHKQIQITFDDGFKGIYFNRKYLKAEEIYPTIFIITSFIGKPNYLTWTELRELRDLGFNLQSHTHNHPDLNTLTLTQLNFELKTSKKLLEENLDIVIDEICFPKGLFDDQVLKSCYLNGYKKWFCSIPGNNEEHCIYKELKFRNLVQFSSRSDFKNIIHGGMRIFQNRYTKSHYGKNIFSTANQ